jgi:hypothetical protein
MEVVPAVNLYSIIPNVKTHTRVTGYWEGEGKLCLTQVDRWRHEKITRIYFQHISYIHKPVGIHTLGLYVSHQMAENMRDW